MKRLEIVLIGHSQAMSELSAELDAHGHLIHHLRDRGHAGAERGEGRVSLH